MLQRGVKTEQERELLEYRPIIQYVKQLGMDINNVVIPKGYEVDSEIREVIDRLPSNTTRTIVSFNNKLQSLISTVESMLIETPAFPNPVNASAVEEAAAQLGLDVTNGITYEIYKGLMEDPYNDEYEKQIIIEAWRKYHADVNGSLTGEYYTELLELNKDINNLMNFWTGSVLKYINPELSLTAVNSETILPQIEDAERILVDKLLLYKSEVNSMVKKIRDHQIKTMDPNDPANIAFDRLKSRHKAIDDQYSIMIRQGNVMCEVTDIINKKLGMNGYAIQQMDRYLKFTPQNPYSGKLVDALEALLKGCLESDFLNAIKRLRVIMKYQIDGSIKSIIQEKEKSDAVFSTRVKQAVQDICLRDIAVKVGVCHPLLRELSNVPFELSKSMAPISDKLIEGLREAERQYGNDIVQLYGAHTKSAEAFTGRVESMQDKGVSRDFYRILTMMITYIENGGDSPTTGSLRQWIINLLNSAELNQIYDYSVGDKVQLDMQ